MKRDMELVRKLLFLAEEDGKDDELCEEYGQDVVAGHVAILLDAKLIVGEVVCNEVGEPVASVILRLTWAGHEFLDNARNDTIWRGVLSKIKSAALTVSFDVLAELLKSGAMSAIQHLKTAGTATVILE